MGKGWRAILARVQQIVDSNPESKAIAEFQASRQRTVAALRYFLLLLVIPLLVNHWIFRYLNRNSPSAVATYHRMND